MAKTTTHADYTATALTLTTAAQPNITSVGTLTALTGGTGDLNWDSGTLFVDSSANKVGIGTASPTENLEVAGNIFINTSGNPNLTVKTSGAGNNPTLKLQADSAHWQIQSTFSNTNDELFFMYNSSTKLAIDNGGNVGIGTESPSGKLHVTDSSVLDINLVGNPPELNLEDTSSTSGQKRARLTLNDQRLNIQGLSDDDSALTHQFITCDLSSGNIGIGITSPATILHAKASGDCELRLEAGTNSDARVRFGDATDNDKGYIGYNRNSGYMNFSVVNTSGEAMRIDSSGRLMVGTTTNANLATHTPNVVTDESYGIVDSSANKAVFGVDRISFNVGNYYVLNENAAGVRLINGQTSWTTQSDESLKENIVELTGVIDKIKDYRCVEYNLINDKTKSKKIGFIAQDWQKDYDQVVSQDDDGTLGLQYTETIPVLLKAIQELKAEIEELKENK
tara:strand:- start:1422 stop:2777 length:1356 start_codon:yes stop_codon:yes gene_type:complete